MRASATLLALLLLGGLLTACGARTGLFWGDAPDGGEPTDTGPPPDVFGPFPCAYFPAGHPVSVRESRPLFSVIPQLAYGGDRLGLTYALRTNMTQPEGSFAFCDTHRDDGYLCPGEQSIDENGLPSPAPVVWNGESFGTCWNGLDRSGIPVPRYRTFSAAGEPLDAPGNLDDEYGVCLDLAWSGDRYVAALLLARSPEAITLQAFDRDGRFLGGPLAEVTRTSGWQVGAVSADAGHEAMVWTDGSTVTLQRLDSGGAVVLRPPDGGVSSLPVVAMRREMAGVLWASRTGATTMWFQLVDTDSGATIPPIEIAPTGGEVFGPAIVAVNEGFVLGWAEEGGGSRIMIYSLSVDGWEVHVWEAIYFYESETDDLMPEAGGPSLVYDGRSVFVAYSALEESTGRYQVRLQELDCHR